MTSPILRIELGEEIQPRVDSPRTVQWRWSCRAMALEGVSREPLLDACRELKSMGAAPDLRVGLFRAGREAPDLSCTVRMGAGLTVDESKTGFHKWKPRPTGAGFVWGRSPVNR